MAFADLTANAKEGLTWWATQAKDKDGIQRWADGKAYMDFIGEMNGLECFQKKVEWKQAKRRAALDDPKNAAIAAQVDALG